MKEDIQVRRNKRLRGEILQLLYAVTPSTIQVATLSGTLMDNGYINNPDIAPFIDYLSDRGYVTVIDEVASAKIFKGVFPPSTFLKLTSKGTDVVEHTVEDPGVDV